MAYDAAAPRKLRYATQAVKAALARGDSVGAKLSESVYNGDVIDIETQRLAVQSLLETPELKVGVQCNRVEASLARRSALVWLTSPDASRT